MAHERREEIARSLGVAALRGQQARKRVVDGVVPLVFRQRGHPHGRSPLTHENHILIFR
jgi:hypothetical protein